MEAPAYIDYIHPDLIGDRNQHGWNHCLSPALLDYIGILINPSVS